MKKRILAVIMSLTLALSMTACGSTQEAPSSSAEQQSESEKSEAKTIILDGKEITLGESSEASVEESSETPSSSEETKETAEESTESTESSESYIPISKLSDYEELVQAMNNTFNGDFTMTLDMTKAAPDYPVVIIFGKKDSSFIMNMKNGDKEMTFAADENNKDYMYLSFTMHDGTLKQKAKGAGTNSSSSISANDLAGEFGLTTELDDKYSVEKIDDGTYKLYENGEYAMTCIVEDGYITKMKRIESAGESFNTTNDTIEVELSIVRSADGLNFNEAEFEETDPETFAWSVIAAIMYVVATDDMIESSELNMEDFTNHN